MKGAEKPMQLKMSRPQMDLLRAFNEFTPEKRLQLNSLISELMMRASPELLEQREKAIKDPSLPMPKPSWRFIMKKTRQGRRLELHEEVEYA